MYYELSPPASKRVGVFKNIADEFYRRYAVPYEDEKIAEHGDVYEA